MPLQFEARLHPLYCIGDSHSAIFNHLLYREPVSQRYLLSRSGFIPELRARDFSHKGELHPQLLQFLQQEQLLQDLSSPSQQPLRLRLRRPAAAPVCVFFCGSGDLFDLLRQLGEQFDFFWPTPEFGPPQTHCQLLPLASLQAPLQQALAPLQAGLKLLKAQPLRLALHDLPPPTPSEQDFERIAGFRCPWSVRSKLTLLMNQALAELAAELELPLIQLWQQVTEQQRLKSDYLLDGVHLNHKAAELSLNQIWQRLQPPQADPHEALLELVSRVESFKRSQDPSGLLVCLQQASDQLPRPEQAPDPDPEKAQLEYGLLLAKAQALFACQHWQALATLLQDYRAYLQACPLLSPQLSSLQQVPPTGQLHWLAGDAIQQPLSLPEAPQPVSVLGRFAPAEASGLQTAWQAANPGRQLTLLRESQLNTQQVLHWLASAQGLGWSPGLSPSYFDSLLLGALLIGQLWPPPPLA